MSIIREHRLALANVIAESNLIVEVECLAPFEEEVPVILKDQSVVIEPFIKRGFNFRVKSILKNTTKNPVPDAISVPQEDWKRFFSQHVEAYANGPSKSFTVKTYKTKVLNIQNAYILFLHRFLDTFELTVRNSFESKDARKEIERLIKN